MKRWIIAPIVQLSAWIIGYFVITLILSGTSGEQAYGILSGWWCALYLGYVFHIKLFTLIPLIIFYVLVGSTSLFFNFQLFYHDPPNSLMIRFFIILLQACIFISPVVVNAFIRKYLSRLSFKSNE